MVKPIEKKLLGAVVKRRQAEIGQCFADFGLARGPRRLRVATAACESPPCRRLRAALTRLGPVFSSFGIYLSSRADLLPVDDCVELSAIPDRVLATPIAAVGEL